MKRRSAFSKLIPLVWILALLLTISGALAFPHSILGDAGHVPAQQLTIAGQTRGCSQYPDETGTFVGAMTIQSRQYPALVDVYYVTSTGGWTYYNEFSAPVSFSGGNRQYAYEVYYCPVQAATQCSSGQTRAVTETTYQACTTNGQWGPTQQCAPLTYFEPHAGQCVSTVTTCKEQWTCGQFGACTAQGQQYRTCQDLNACGTFLDKPTTSQACTPTLSNGAQNGSTGNGVKLIGQPTLDAYTGAAGQARIVTQLFNVTAPGQYWIEAGVEQLRGFDISGTVEKNTCNPNEPWYANALVTFNAPGVQTYQFTVTPQTDGEYVLHTAIVTGCGGSVVQQINAADHLIIGNPQAGQATAGSFVEDHLGALIAIAIGVVLAIIGSIVLLWRKRR